MPVAVPFPKIELHVRLEGDGAAAGVAREAVERLRTAIRERTILRTR